MHVLVFEHAWTPADEPSGKGNIIRDTCKSCGQTRRGLRISTDDPGDEQVDPERVWQTWGALLSGIQKEFTQLTGFESPEEALNKLKGRYRGINAEWKDMTIRDLNRWVLSSGRDQETKALLAWRQGPVCNRCDSVARSLSELEVDHIIPESKGGPSKLSNYQLLCRTCNGKKDDNMPDAMDQSAFDGGHTVLCLHKCPARNLGT